MNELFLLFLSLSLSGSILALLLLAVRPLLGKRLSRSWQYYIWLVVLLRFLLPFSPATSAVGELFHSARSTAAVVSAGVLPQAAPGTDNASAPTGGLRPGDSPGRTEIAEADNGPRDQVETAASRGQGLLTHAWVAWLGVALVLLAYKAATYQSFVRFARAGAVEVSGGRLHDLYLDELAIGNIKGRPRLYVNSLISSPMLVGVCRPAVILPSPEDSGELRYILRHELTHYKRRDGIYKWLAQLVLCLHWFNPLVYLVSKQLGKACELACDEAVVKRLDPEGRMGYGDALMASLKVQGSYSSSVISITMSEDAGTIRERLDAIAGYRGKPLWARGASAALTVLLLCGFAFTGAYRGTGQVAPYTDSQASTGSAGERISGDSPNPASRGAVRGPETVETVTARAGGPVALDANVEIVIADNAAVHLAPTSSDEISADYADGLYAVSVERKNGDWRIRIAYTGSYSTYPAAMLYLPDVVYGNVNIYAEEATVYFDGVFRRGGEVNAHLENCSVFYTVPTGFEGTLNAVAPGSYFQLHSGDGYQNCAVTIANCATFGNIADGFAKQGDSLVYRHGTAAGTLQVDMAGDGYATIEQGPYQAPTSSAAGESGTDGLTLVEREYSVAELRARNIWGVKVMAASEQVSVTTGGQALKLQYYQESDGDYLVETVPDRGGTVEELYLRRNAPPPAGELQRAIHITLPDSFACDVLHITTVEGTISLDGCQADTVMLATQNGRIEVSGGAVDSYFSAASADGSIDISGTLLSPGEFANHLQTESGAVRLRLPGPSGEYAYKIDAGDGARIQIGGERYSGGSAYTVNRGAAAGTIKFTSGSGSLTVEDV